MRDSRGWMLVVAAVLVVSGCKDRKLKPDDDEQKQKKVEKKEEQEPKEIPFDATKPATVGLVTMETATSTEKVVSSLEKQIEEEGGLTMTASLDHGKNAESADAELSATRLLVFDNPQLDLPFLQKSITIGLDYPSKILVWKTSDGETRVAVNAPAYAAKRHGIERLDIFLGRQESTISSMLEEATGARVPTMPKKTEIGVDDGQGVVRKESNNGVTDTFEKLKGLLEEKEGIEVMATVDYQTVAKANDKSLQPARLVVFGNPTLGTPLMKKSRTAGLDLPQKMFVFGTKEGAIYVTYNEPKYLAKRHGIDPETEAVQKMSEALDDLSDEACVEIED